jgi:hypothetical protein
LHDLAQLDEIVRSRDGNEQEAARCENTSAFVRMTPRVQRQHEAHAVVEERQPPIGVRDQPGERSESPSGVCSGRRREVDANADDGPRRGQRAQGFTRSGAEIDRHGPRAKLQRRRALDERVEYRAPNSRGQQPGARLDGRLGVARLQGAAILRLQQVEVPAPGDVVRMPARADERTFAARQRLSAVANRACKRCLQSLKTP